ncbi:MAG: SdpI family protein [Propionibacteriaceae bacterium]|jgi:uncharacterized membrane protein|nr:SdpI family protein [Propionibacteriaceae bacterium]
MNDNSTEYTLQFLSAAACLIILVMVGALWLTCALAAKQRLGANPWAGIRLPSTMRSDAAWMAGHRAALALCHSFGPWLIGLSIIAMLSIAAWPLVTAIAEAVILALTIIWFIMAIRAAIHAAQQAPDDATVGRRR